MLMVYIKTAKKKVYCSTKFVQAHLFSKHCRDSCFANIKDFYAWIIKKQKYVWQIAGMLKLCKRLSLYNIYITLHKKIAVNHKFS